MGKLDEGKVPWQRIDLSSLFQKRDSRLTYNSHLGNTHLMHCLLVLPFGILSQRGTAYFCQCLNIVLIYKVSIV